MTLGVYRASKARRSRDGTPMMGTDRAWASVLAVVTPTRIPVNRPGPSPIATAESCREVRPGWGMGDSQAGGEEHLAVGGAARDRAGADDALLGPHGDRSLRRRGLDAEHQHLEQLLGRR